MAEKTKNIEELEKRLITVEQKENKYILLKGALNYSLFLSTLIPAAVLIELAFNMGSTARSVTFFLSTIAALGLLIYFIAISWFFKRNKHTQAGHLLTAGKIGSHFAFIKDELKNALQIAYENNSGYSEQLSNAALSSVMAKSSDIDFSGIITFKPLRQKIRAAIASGVILVLLFFSVTPMSSALYRLVNFNKDFSTPPKYIFLIKPGNSYLTKGESLKISVEVNDKKLTEIYLWVKSSDETGFHEKAIVKNGNGIFVCNFDNVQNSIVYYASAEDVKSELYNITVVGRPVITGFEVKITPPAYSNIPVEILSDNGNITALPGSKTGFKISSSRELKSAVIEFSDSTKTGLKINGSKAEGEITVKKDVTYHFMLTDKEGNSTINPAEYSIKTILDAYPVIQLLSPGNNNEISSSVKLNVIAKISDDFGFSKLILNYRISESKYEKPTDKFTSVQMPLKSSTKEQDIYYTWDLSGLRLSEGDAVSYYLEVYDNDNVNGPKSAKTDVYVLRVPTIEEIFKNSEKEELAIEKEMNDVLEESKKLKEELKKNINELKKDKRELTWEEKNNITKNLENLEKVENKIEDVKNKLSEMQKDMNRNDLLSKETMDKYAELQNLFEELNSQELKQSIQKLQEALKSMMRDKAQQSLEKLSSDEEYLKNSIERTLNLLKRIRVEQKIDELLKRVHDLIEKTDDLNKKTQNSNLNDKQENEGLEDRQQDITGGLKGLDSEMKKTNELMKELSDMPKDEMKKVMDEFQKQKNDKLSQSAETAIRQIQKENASQSQRTLSKNLADSEKLIAQMKKSFLKQNQIQSFKEMMKVLDNIIILSKNQEKLRKETEKIQYNSDQYKEKMLSQNELKNILSKIIQQVTDLSQKTMGITPEMGKALGNAFINMQNAINIFQNMGGYAVPSQRSAMEGLNQAASLLKGSMDQMMGGGEGGGMMSLMQQLQQMGRQQMDLNKMTQQMNSGGLSMQERAGLQRLAQQQDLIRKSLEKLNREAKESGQSKSLAGSLDKTLQEMQSVVKEMKGGKLNDEIVKQQERILSRMLDSQRSLNEKDFEKNRESKSGGNFDLNSPGQLNLKQNSKNKLRDELLKAVKEGYKKDYEELIKRYFEVLEKKGNKK